MVPHTSSRNYRTSRKVISIPEQRYRQAYMEQRPKTLCRSSCLPFRDRATICARDDHTLPKRGSARSWGPPARDILHAFSIPTAGKRGDVELCAAAGLNAAKFPGGTQE